MDQQTNLTPRKRSEQSENYVKLFYPEAKVEEVYNETKFYIHDPSTGMALSPICIGPASAWRFAELHIRFYGRISYDTID